MTAGRWWAPQAWLADGWHHGVLLEAGADGCWQRVEPGFAAPPPQAEPLDGPALPGFVNGHSHAFQRAFVGLSQRRGPDGDDFWSWRERMYQVALRLSPDRLRDIAAQLYVELLQGGYTQVCEFHYLQHAPDGRPYAPPTAFAEALADAAAEAGIGLTLLPVLYERAGFDQPALRAEQRRFALGAEQVWAMREMLAGLGRPLVNTGLAVHSLRAAAPKSIRVLRALAEDFAGPIHIHVAEQQREVDDCVAATGARPIEWLLREDLLDERWQLVHATHTERAEIAGVAGAGAGVVLCPGTEADLGDGLPDLPTWLDAGVPLALGSDSQVLRAAHEELRLLEYGQRLALRRRGVAATAQQPSTAQALWERLQDPRAGQPAGLPTWGLRVGARADLLVLDTTVPALAGLPMATWLDALVFGGAARPWRDVMVAGRWPRRGHHQTAEARTAPRLSATLHSLWA